MSHGSTALAIAGCLAFAACNVSTLEAPPAYPGSSLGPGSRYTENGITSLKQMYMTPDAYAEVVNFYKSYVAEEPGWQGEPNLEMTTWTKNMRLEGAGDQAVPLDPSKPGKMILLINAGQRVMITTYAAYPATDS